MEMRRCGKWQDSGVRWSRGSNGAKPAILQWAPDGRLRGLAMTHELGHVRMGVAQSRKSGPLWYREHGDPTTLAEELVAWVWAFIQRGNRRGIQAAAKALTTYGQPHAAYVLGALLDQAGVPRRGRRTPPAS